MHTISSSRRLAPNLGIYGVLVPWGLLAALGCSEPSLGAATPDDGEIKRWQVSTARGPVTLAYEEVDGWAVADGDIVLGRTDRVTPRDFHIGGGASWPSGIVAYVWDVDNSPSAECGVNTQQFCVGEWQFLTQSAGPDVVPVWEEFKQHVLNETPLSLVDATECWYDNACKQYLEPGSFIFVRRPALIAVNDNQTTCDAVNNTKIQATSFTLGAVAGEVWELEIDGESWSIVGTGDAEDDAQAIYDVVVNDPDYGDLPITVIVSGAKLTFQAKQPVSFPVSLVGMVTGGDNVDRDHAGSCVGAKGCANSDCAAGFTCVDVWPYDGEFSVDDTGYCQQGSGMATLGPGSPNDPERFIGIPTSWFHQRSFAGMAHELTHVAGFIHEHQRPDNYDSVFRIADETCRLYPGVGDLDKNENYDLMGWSSPLDWASIMMYSSGSLCKPTPECKDMCLNARTGNCPNNICAPNDAYNDDKPAPTLPDLDIIRRPGWFEGLDRLGGKIDRGRLSLSYKDQDAMRMYAGDAFAQAFVEGQCPWYPDDGDMYPEQSYSGAEVDDAFGSALAIGRFGDEDHAVLVGMPGEAEDHLDIKTGAVTVWESNRYTLELNAEAPKWEIINKHVPAIPILSRDQFMVPQEFDGSVTPEPEDRFGHAVAAVDFDGDGIDEIAVGAPHAGFNATGLVFIYRTADLKKKHKPWRVLRPDDDFEPYEFGHALATGNFAGTDVDDSCDSRHQQELAVGAPRMPDDTGSASGAVYVYRYDRGTADFVRRAIVSPGAQDGERFGHALAAADLDLDNRDGLVVGAPSYGADDRGRVYFFESDAPADLCDMQLEFKGTREATLAGAALGSALAAGDFLRGTGEFLSADDVAVGAPRPASAGFVELFKGPGNPIAAASTFSPHTVLKQVASGIDSDELGDEFGYALAVTEFSSANEPRPAYLFIGAPSERNEQNTQTGAVYQVRFQHDIAIPYMSYPGDERVTSACDAGPDFGCGLSTDDSEHAERFGAALAADRRIVVMGDPGYDLAGFSDVGAARIYVRERDPGAVDGWHLMRWFTEVNEWPSVSNGVYVP